MGKNLGGRPKKQVDQRVFESLCSMQCTKDEICAVCGGIDEKTLTRWCQDTYGEGFSDIYKKKSLNGKASLRRAQFRLAETNTTMAIWLGKQYLGQRDKFPDEINYEDINRGLLHIASLINNPVDNRTEKDVKSVETVDNSVDN